MAAAAAVRAQSAEASAAAKAAGDEQLRAREVLQDGLRAEQFAGRQQAAEVEAARSAAAEATDTVAELEAGLAATRRENSQKATALEQVDHAFALCVLHCIHG